MLLAWIKRMVGFRGNTMEDNVLDLLKQNPQVYVVPAINFFKNAPAFSGVGRDYISPSGRVTVCDDIYGYEVHIDGNNELLDCCPEAYGLTHEEGRDLYNAILCCVPGSCFFKDRVMEARNAQQ